ncbi:hypothetical protein HUO09_17415 [Vibrio sp. Y2-5]|uniref:hypothetical protein n=1 Tax=Vibrio sp. Y2-5 TaxID=2743977 RepID=UPI001661559D|nr:hypothetical protein [Vibrio sp. Y2-5]MBD0788136.1 hypothetical protein [Vibrio sp. Y2-5]
MNNAIQSKMTTLTAAPDLHHEFAMSAKTSIYRAKPSLPLRTLLDRNLLQGSTLNFGKGKYDVDSLAITENIGIQCIDYDYTWAKWDIMGSSFKSVVAMYVLNTLSRQGRDFVWNQLARVTDDSNGSLFVAVRSDRKGMKGEPFEDGVKTSRGTIQVAYTDEMLISEATQYFGHVEIIQSNSSFILCKCKHAAEAAIKADDTQMALAL